LFEQARGQDVKTIADVASTGLAVVQDCAKENRVSLSELKHNNYRMFY
jgi:hypothetical protein